MAENPYEGVMFPVKATVSGGSGEGCRARHAPGQEWFMKGVPAGICSFAFNAMFPAYWTLRFGGRDPAEADPDAINVKCSNANCAATFRLTRISGEEAEQLERQSNAIAPAEIPVIGSGVSRRVR